MTLTAEWIERMREVPIAVLAPRLGLKPTRASPGAWAFSPCPVCGQERRHTKSRDKRGAIGVGKRQPSGWRCFQCDSAGDGIDLVACRLRGNRFRELDEAGKTEVRDWCQGYLGMIDAAPAQPLPVLSTKPVKEASPEYPPAEEVRAFWETCIPVVEDPAVSKWLWESLTSSGYPRRIDTRLIADYARVAVPGRTKVPPWAGPGYRKSQRWESWPEQGLRLVMPLYDASGRMRSFSFRLAVFDTGSTCPPEKRPPTGYQRSGLVMADSLGRQILETGKRPEWWPSEQELRVVIAEGETDFLTACTYSDAVEYAPATFGIFSGSWKPAIADRIPDGATVVIATDTEPESDPKKKPAGDIYAEEIIRTLTERMRVGKIKVERWRP